MTPQNLGVTKTKSYILMPILVDEDTWQPIGTSDLMPELNLYNNKNVNF